MQNKVKGVVGEKSIILHYGGDAITIQSETDRLLFEEFKELIKSGDMDTLIQRFLSVKERIEKYTNKTFYIKSGKLFLKGDDVEIPELLAKKLLELEATDADFMPLVRFWKKLKSNPSSASIEQLYGFIEANNIPITEMGDIVTEKGVNQRIGAPAGELVDARTGKVDNSIGMEVVMDRSKVDPNPNQTCSHGLHVGAPDYVRRFYSQNILVECVVNPRDVVAVPTDYKNTKMRVCRYVVVGYSSKVSAKDKPVYKLSEFIKIPEPEVQEKLESLSSSGKLSDKGVDKDVISKKAKDETKVNKRLLNKYMKKLAKKTARQVLDLVKEKLDIELPHNPKSKAAIVKKAAKLFAEDEEVTTRVIVKPIRGVRTEDEIYSQVAGLKRDRESLPEYSTFGNPNWGKIDAQIAVISGKASPSDYPDSEDVSGEYDPESEEEEIRNAAEEAEQWLNNKDYGNLFDE